MNDLTTKRLAVIKQLYLQGVNQSYEVEPINGFSILSFHDSVEMFMKLCAEQKGIRIDRHTNFSDYFSKIPDLKGGSPMVSLNSRRVSLKHSGLLPSKLDIEISRRNTMDFFEENTPIFFGKRFGEISLISLIKYPSVCEYLEDSQVAINENKYEEAIKISQVAFKELLHCHHEENSKDFLNPFSEVKSFTFHKSFFIKPEIGKRFDKFVDDVSLSIPRLEEAVKIIGFGIDYRQYCKFRLFTPIICVEYVNDERQYSVGASDGRLIFNLQNARFCFDFVVLSALKLQEFCVDLKNTIK